MFHPTHLLKSTAIEVAGDPLKSPSEKIDLHRLLSLVAGNKYLITKSCLLSLLGVFLLIVLVPAQYTAVTQLLIDPNDLRVVENGLTTSSQLAETNILQVESQVRVLTSDNVLRRVIIAE